MDFNKLNIFYTVATQNNISTASEVLHMSRQNISKVLRALEESLGHQLLIRTSSGVKLTEKGVIFLEYISKVRELSQELQHQLANVSEISYSLLACYQLQESMSDLLYANFDEGITLNLFNEDANYINSSLKKSPRELDNYDFILSCGDDKIMRTFNSLPSFTNHELTRQPIGVIVGDRHALSHQYAPNAPINPNDLPPHHLIAMTNKLQRTPLQVQLIQNRYSTISVSRLTNDLRVFKDGILYCKYYGFSDLFGFHTLFDGTSAQWHPIDHDPILLSYFCLISHDVTKAFRQIFLSMLRDYIDDTLAAQ